MGSEVHFSSIVNLGGFNLDETTFALGTLGASILPNSPAQAKHSYFQAWCQTNPFFTRFTSRYLGPNTKPLQCPYSIPP